MVALAFGEPIGGVGFWQAVAAGAGVGVPEAAVDEDDFAAGGEDEVGGAGEVGAVESETVAEAVGEGADEEFRGGVLGFDGFRQGRGLWEHREF